MANPTIVVGSKFDAKGFKRAETATEKLTKNVKKLGLAFGVAFTAKAVVNFGKQSLNAFLADDKAVKALGQTLKNTGNEISGKGANSFIDKLQRATGVSDDQLRPALTNLLNSTQNYSVSQKELNLALDIATGTGKDVVSVSAALAKAYAGNTTSLTKLGTGISKTVLASGDMVAINKELAKLFAGQATIAANTYAGKLDRIKVAASEAQETIGKGLVVAITNLAGSAGMDSFVKQMDNAAQDVSDMIIGFSELIRMIEKVPIIGTGVGGLFESLGVSPLGEFLKYLGKLKRLEGSAMMGGMPSGAQAISAQESRTKAAADKAERDRIAREKRIAAAKLLSEKKLAALKISLSKGAAAFDLDKIQLIAALKMNIDEDTRKRLLLMQALQGDDNDLIMRRLKELADYTQNADLRKLAGLKTITDAQLKALNDTLIAEVDAINKSKMSQDDKNKAIMEALNKYDAAVKAQGGATADQSDNLRILQIRNILAIATAQAIADKQKQDALELYMRTLGLNTRAITPLDGGGGFFAGGGFTPPMISGGNGTGGTDSGGYFDYSAATSADLAAQQFGGGGSTTINNITVEGTVVDSAGLLAAIQGGVQTINRNGSSLSGVAGILATYL